MDLWVRSQDRKEMTKLNYIRITERTNHCLNRDEYIIQDEEYCDLGTYKTEERALEVLDEIHSLIKDASNPSNWIFPNSITFEMPLE